MLSETQTGGTSPVWEPAVVSVWPNFQESLVGNIIANSKLSYPFLTEIKHLKKSRPLAIVGGGPSLKSTIDDLRAFKGDVLVCSSAHDHVISQGVAPNYTVFCDAMPSPQWFTLPQAGCTYLLATQCHPTLFTQLSGHRIVMWHVAGDYPNEIFEGRGQIPGGCTAALRAIALGMVLGYEDLHFFGVDSSFEDDKFAYPDDTDTNEIYDAELNGRVFKTTLPLIAQAQDLQRLCENYGHLFSVTVHGDSLFADVWKDMRAKTDALINRERAA